MRTPVFHSFDSWQLSGVNTWSLNLEQAMRDDSQFENILLFTGQPYECQAELLSYGAPYAHLELPSARSRASEWLALKNFLEANAPCIYIPGYDFHRSSAIPTLSHDVRVCTIVHSDEECYYDIVGRIGYASDAIVTVSSHLGREVSKRFPQVASRVKFIPSAVPAMRPNTPRSKRGRLELIYCNRLSEYQKRISELPKVMIELLRSGIDCHLTVAGDGPDASELVQQFERAGVSALVSMMGKLSMREVTDVVTRAHVFLLVSDFEGLPMSMLEAMSAGCVPVVYRIKSGVSDAIEDGVSGIMVPHGDVAAMAREIVSLHSDRHRLESISQAAVQRHAERFSLERMSADYRQLFGRLIADGAKVPRRDGRIRKSPDLTLRYRLMRKAGFLR